MSFVLQIKESIRKAIVHLYQKELPFEDLTINETKPEFEGDYTFVTFSLTKLLGKKPEDIGNELGEYLLSEKSLFTKFNVIKGFLNLSLNNEVFIDFLNTNWTNNSFGKLPATSKKVMVEYSSPNTNKPLHFGHLRNIFLGYAVSEILKANGDDTIKANLINDRGIHICKSMIAWQLFGNGATPESTNIKGDHLVGDYYVKFNDEYKKQIAELVENGITAEEAEKKAPIMLQAQDLLRKWEANDADTISLWKTMNSWVYAGFEVSYKKLGIDFDKIYYESETYLSGKKIIEKGLQNGALIQKEDNSIWIDLTDDGLDQKLLLRGDGTSVYITQDIGTAVLKYNDFKTDESIYVIGDEQNYHMQVLKLILQKLKESCADGVHHLSYGMVELPTGKMKSREGTVVDADDMMDEMIQIAQKNTEELGKVDGFTSDELNELYYTLGMGALKFYLLRVDPKKRMIFNPQESIDFHGFTGPFVQFSHARIASILRKAEAINSEVKNPVTISETEKKLLRLLEQYPATIAQAAYELNPSLICNFVYQVAKDFNGFLVDHSVLKAENEELKNFRLKLCMMTKHVISSALLLLGIRSPERM